MAFKSSYRMVLMLISAVVLALSSCAGPKKVTKTYYDPRAYFKDHDVKSLPRFDVPIEVNDRVIAWIEYFQGPGRRHYERYLQRSGRYLPMMKEVLRQEGVPEDLVYISMIESGFSPHAYSRAHAAGLWQFIQSTGRLYDLDVTGFEDERRDPWKATRAAARHFKDLYNDFGDWYLAMAAYNAGPMKVTRAISATGSRNFWDMARHRSAFRPETRDYVPKFIAAAIIAKMPSQFGFDNVTYDNPVEFDTATVDSQTDISVLADCAGVDTDTMKDLNAHLFRGVTPPGDYTVRVPKGKAQRFKEEYAKLPEDKKIRFVYHRVKKGDTLAKVARRYGVSVSALASANGLKTKSGLKRGSTLMIPGKGAASYAALSDDSPRGKKGKGGSAKKLVHHKVIKGETLASIADRYDVTTSQLKGWNRMGRKTTIHAGQKLKVYRSAVASADEQKEVTGSAESAAASTDTAEKVSGEPAKVSDIATGDAVAKAEVSVVPDLEKKNVHDKIAASTSAVDLLKKDKKAEKIAVTKSYVVKKGDTIGTIAARNKISAKQLMAANGIKNPKSLRVGQKLKIRTEVTAKGKTEPAKAVKVGVASAKAKPEEAAAAVPEGSSEAGAKTTGIVTPAFAEEGAEVQGVKASEPTSLPSDMAAVPSAKAEHAGGAPVKLASSKDVNEAKIADANGLTYSVRNGDTLWDIARRHKVSISDIQKWNNLSDPSAVKPGTKLTIKR